MEPGAKIAFGLTQRQGAALITKDYTHREDVQREGTFKSYTKRHYDSWVAFAQKRGDGEDVRPILVTGVDLTKEYATVAYSDNQTHLECEFSAQAPTVGSASVSLWGSWRTRGLVHTKCGPYSTRGNRSSDESTVPETEIPDEYDQCVFIRYYTVRKRAFIPTVIKAGAGPHQLPEGNHGDENSHEDGLQPLSAGEPMEVDHPETGSPGEAFDEVIHNVPAVGPKYYSCIPPFTDWIKDDRDSFDIVAEFIFQVRTSSWKWLV